MTIAIVIGTHGWAAEQLLKTAEMLLGEQENVGWIDFVPGENAETLIEKYNAQLAKLDTTKGVLFLVDTWGGSPFNAASRIVVDKEHYEVIAGVNIPMLVETLMARDDDPVSYTHLNPFDIRYKLRSYIALSITWLILRIRICLL